MKSSFTRIRIWRVPFALGLISTSGLIAALLADGIGDIVSWVALAVPIVVAFGYAVRHA